MASLRIDGSSGDDMVMVVEDDDAIAGGVSDPSDRVVSSGALPMAHRPVNHPITPRYNYSSAVSALLRYVNMTFFVFPNTSSIARELRIRPYDLVNVLKINLVRVRLLAIPRYIRASHRFVLMRTMPLILERNVSKLQI